MQNAVLVRQEAGGRIRWPALTHCFSRSAPKHYILISWGSQDKADSWAPLLTSWQWSTGSGPRDLPFEQMPSRRFLDVLKFQSYFYGELSMILSGKQMRNATVARYLKILFVHFRIIITSISLQGFLFSEMKNTFRTACCDKHTGQLESQRRLCPFPVHQTAAPSQILHLDLYRSFRVAAHCAHSPRVIP